MNLYRYNLTTNARLFRWDEVRFAVTLTHRLPIRCRVSARAGGPDQPEFARSVSDVTPFAALTMHFGAASGGDGTSPQALAAFEGGCQWPLAPSRRRPAPVDLG